MAGFNPDEFLKAPIQKTSGFDPGEFLSEKKQTSKPTASSKFFIPFEAIAAPFQVAGEAIRGAGENTPMRMAGPEDERGYRAPTIVQRFAPSLRTKTSPTDPFVKAYQGLEGLVNLPRGAQAASDVVTGEPDLAANLGGLALSVGIPLGKAGKVKIKKPAFIQKAKDTLNAPRHLEEALGSAAQRYGTYETPSMVGNTARESFSSGQASNELLAQKLYSKVQKDTNVSTPRLASKYEEIADELPTTIQNLIKKNIQIGENPIRPNDIGTTNTRSLGRIMPDDVPVYPYQYSASPGVPSQLPPNRPPVSDLIKLRSKLGKIARGGGIEGYNAGELRSALDADIANLGEGGGPLGEMMQEAVNEPLKRATSYYRGMMEQQSTPLFRKLSTGKAEDIPEYVFGSGRTQDVLEGRALLGEEGFSAVKKSFFNKLINSKDVSKELSKYAKNNSDFLSTVFNRNEIETLKTISSLQKRAEEAAKTVDRAKMLLTGAAAVAVGGGLAGKALKFGLGE